MTDDARKELLWPSWAANGNSARYDELSDDVTRTVWRMTRGQKIDADSMIVWLDALAAGVRDGLITETDARAAIARIGEHEDG